MVGYQSPSSTTISKAVLAIGIFCINFCEGDYRRPTVDLQGQRLNAFVFFIQWSSKMYVYAISPSETNFCKVGMWTGTLDSLRTRYVTCYGKYSALALSFPDVDSQQLVKQERLLQHYLYSQGLWLYGEIFTPCAAQIKKYARSQKLLLTKVEVQNFTAPAFMKVHDPPVVRRPREKPETRGETQIREFRNLISPQPSSEKCTQRLYLMTSFLQNLGLKDIYDTSSFHLDETHLAVPLFQDASQSRILFLYRNRADDYEDFTVENMAKLVRLMFSWYGISLSNTRQIQNMGKRRRYYTIDQESVSSMLEKINNTSVIESEDGNTDSSTEMDE